jgi:two-component system sensor histidine kinase AgrC
MILYLKQLILGFLENLCCKVFFEASNKKCSVIAKWKIFKLLSSVFTIGAITAIILTFGNVHTQKQANVLIILVLGLIAMNTVIAYLIEMMIQREQKLYENEIFEMQVRNQTRMYHSISENFDKQKRKTHEYKNHIMCIESLVRKENYMELESYVKEIGQNLSRELDAIDTNHVIVNAILNTKYQEARDKNIVFVIYVNDLSGIKMGDEDVVVILSNLLNNAMEACDKCINKRLIKLKFIKEEDNVIISVKNTYNHLLQYENGELITTKWEHKDEHGNGLNNIIDTIEKYNGSYIIKHDKKEFYLSIILNA